MIIEMFIAVVLGNAVYDLFVKTPVLAAWNKYKASKG